MVSEREWNDYFQEDPLRPHLRNRQPSVVSIFRVPEFLKDTKKEAYVPQRVSLGPYHRESRELSPMVHHKVRALRRMMKRFNANRNLPVDLNNMDFPDRARTEILQLENEIRDSYEENIDCDGDTLARMLCLDGCFLLEVLRALRGEEEEDSIANPENCYDPIFGNNKLYHAASDIVHDILMLENQIPFIVLLKLLELEVNSAVDVEEKLLDLLVEGISGLLILFDNDNEYFDRQQWSCRRHHHLLGFLHTVITSRPSSSQGDHVDRCCCSSQCISILHCKRKASNDADRIPHAVELRNAGITFSPLKGGCIKQINFDKNRATIFLPTISITDQTERVFRNLIAYEMCKPSEINFVTTYVALMNDLIDTEQDVALMRRMGVMSSWIGSDEEIADLFNGLGKEVTVPMSEDVFDKLAENVNAHYNNEMKVQIGKLVHDHFSSPWTAFALTAAILIVVLTVLQTIFTIISTYNNK